MTNWSPWMPSTKSISAPIRYWTLMGSTSRRTPSVSTTVSPSSTDSSKVKPYWNPEQPPPCTKMRSISRSLPSSVINSRTFFAALDVNTSGLASVATWLMVPSY